MNLKNIVLTSTIVLASLFATAQKYPLGKDGRTTKQGIQQYVMDKDSIVNSEFDKKFKTNSIPIDFKTDDLSYYTDYTGEKGYYQGLDGAGEAIIDHESTFENYSVNLLPPERKNDFIYNSDFVKGTMFHEKAHAYWEMIENHSKRNGVKIYLPKKSEENYEFRKSFLEEGFTEYCAWRAGEIIAPEKYIYPKNLKDSITNQTWEVEYKYSMYFLKNFLDAFPLDFAIGIMLTNAPPTEEEMLNPLFYYRRLKHSELKFSFQNYAPKTQDFKTK